uniref:Uncharacterized protein n=1 Tax=Schizaphis graminum TaxID=13262 RepID=A0A2S2P9P4_SCHGA
MINTFFLYMCYYFLNPIWKRENEDDCIITRAELIAIHGEVFQENEVIETNQTITPINSPTIREIYEEYLEAHTSHQRMQNWATRAGLLCRGINMEFRALAMLMSDTHRNSFIFIFL